MRNILQEKWNNLNGASNVRNYFHGKVMPIGVEDQNLVYQYRAHAYETEWASEGIDLTL